MSSYLQAARRLLRQAAALAVTTLVAPAAIAGGVAFVTNDLDIGAGSLRAALESGASNIRISPAVRDIYIQNTLVYNGTGKLRIRGTGQRIWTDVNTTLLAITEGADAYLSNLSFEGPGGFSILSRGDLGPDPAGKGIFVDVRDDQEGTVRLVLRNVAVSHVANHGIHVSDCSLADDCGGGGGGGGDGSAAAVAVYCFGCSVHDAGNGKFDADGLRVDDRGDGGIYFFANGGSFTGVGADGVELDEGNGGDVKVHVFNTVFNDNGIYCDPGLLEPFVPDPDEAEFDEADEVTEDQVPVVDNAPDNGCIEREVDLYDSGFVKAYEFGIDVDDGFDIDEAGDGDLSANIRGTVISGNFDEGLDFDEEGEGGVSLQLVGVDANGNTDDGVKVSEEDGGDVVARVRRSNSADNGGKGFVFEEADDGDLRVSVVRTSTSNNDDSDDTGIEAVQEDAGSGTLKVRRSDIADGIDTDGVDLL